MWTLIQHHRDEILIIIHYCKDEQHCCMDVVRMNNIVVRMIMISTLLCRWATLLYRWATLHHTHCGTCLWVCGLRVERGLSTGSEVHWPQNPTATKLYINTTTPMAVLYHRPNNSCSSTQSPTGPFTVKCKLLCCTFTPRSIGTKDSLLDKAISQNSESLHQGIRQKHQCWH